MTTTLLAICFYKQADMCYRYDLERLLTIVYLFQLLIDTRNANAWNRQVSTEKEEWELIAKSSSLSQTTSSPYQPIITLSFTTPMQDITWPNHFIVGLLFHCWLLMLHLKSTTRILEVLPTAFDFGVVMAWFIGCFPVYIPYFQVNHLASGIRFVSVCHHPLPTYMTSMLLAICCLPN